MGMLKYKGYSGSVEYSAEDNCLCGKVQGLRMSTIIYEGMSLDDIRNDFEQSVDAYLAGCAARGVEPEKPYSGRLVLRMSPELHGDVALASAKAGTTVSDK